MRCDSPRLSTLASHGRPVVSQRPNRAGRSPGRPKGHPAEAKQAQFELLLTDARRGRWFAALASLREWFDQGLRPNVVSIAATTNGLAQGVLWQSALQMLDDCLTLSWPVNTFVFNAALSACCRARLSERASKLLEHMNEQGPRPDVVTLNTLLGHYGEKHSKKAQDLLASARTLHIESNLLSHNLCLSALQRSVNWKESLGLLRRTQQLSLSVTDAFTRNSVLAAFMRQKTWSRCLDLWKGARPPTSWADEPVGSVDESAFRADSVAGGAVGSAMMAASLWTSALRVLELLLVRGVQTEAEAAQPSAGAAAQSLEELYAVLGSACMTAAKQTKHPESFRAKAWLITSLLLERGERGNRSKGPRMRDMNEVFLGSSLATCSRSQKWQVSADLLTQIQVAAVETDVLLYNSIGQMSWHQNQKMFQEMCYRHLEPDLASWNLLGSGSWQQSSSLLDALRSKTLRVDEVFWSTWLTSGRTGRSAVPWQTSIQLMERVDSMPVENTTCDHVLSSVMLLSSAKLSWRRSFWLSQVFSERLFSPLRNSDSGLENAVLTAYEEGSGWYQALQTLKQLLVIRCQPEGQGLSAVFTACGGTHWESILTTTRLLSHSGALSFPQVVPCDIYHLSI